MDREGQLVATFDDGSTKALGRVVGKDGESLPVDPEQLAGVVRVEVEKAVAALPAPETVEPREVDMDAVREIVDEMAQQAVSEQLPDAIKAIPVPEAPEIGRAHVCTPVTNAQLVYRLLLGKK